MKLNTFTRKGLLGSLLALSLSLSLGAMLGGEVSAQAKKPAKGKMPMGMAAAKRAEKILGKPLTPAQTKSIREAAMARKKAMDAAQLAYRTRVAKALGMTEAQFRAKSKALDKKSKS